MKLDNETKKKFHALISKMGARDFMKEYEAWEEKKLSSLGVNTRKLRDEVFSEFSGLEPEYQETNYRLKISALLMGKGVDLDALAKEFIEKKYDELFG